MGGVAVYADERMQCCCSNCLFVVAKCVDASKKDAIAVEAGVGNSDTLAAGSCNADDGETVDVDGDEDKMDGPGDYIRQFVHTARASAELERAKRKKRPQSLRAKFASDKDGGDSEDARPFKCIRNSLTSSVTSATAINQQRARRRTKTFEAREQVIKSRLVVVNVKPGLPKKSFQSWEEFEQVLHDYEAKYFLHFRVRSSETLPRTTDRFSHSFKRMWCTHGSTQSSRGEGLRGCNLRYTGCDASFMVRCVRVVKQGIAAWEVAWTRTLRYLRTTTIRARSFTTRIMEQSPCRFRPGSPRLGLLTDIKTSTSDINRYLSKELDMVLTPQQTRNILRKYWEVRRLSDENYSGCFCGWRRWQRRSLRTGTNGYHVRDCDTNIDPEEVFFQWGDTLVMDWTHGTNNLGYHLGNTNNHALDQKAVTMENIVEFFKRKNPSWKSIQTIVIDKDFVEWGYAKVLLCQFHALTYWRKVCKRDKFNMKVTERDTMESAFAKLIY
ncbi:hypothetical protein GQ600_5726 [Phytophthora cactorum]|nr:hypothetical protein GQ600_5726 [Phytophthora cactorum]